MSDEAKALIHRYYAVVNGRDLDGLDALCAPSFRGHAGAGADMDQLKESLGTFLQAFPDLEWKVRYLVAEDDVVSSWVTLEGTHEDVFAGVPGSGRVVKVAAWDLFRIEEGRIVELTSFCDLFTLMNQIGALATTAPA